MSSHSILELFGLLLTDTITFDSTNSLEHPATTRESLTSAQHNDLWSALSLLQIHETKNPQTRRRLKRHQNNWTYDGHMVAFSDTESNEIVIVRMQTRWCARHKRRPQVLVWQYRLSEPSAAKVYQLYPQKYYSKQLDVTFMPFMPLYERWTSVQAWEVLQYLEMCL